MNERREPRERQHRLVSRGIEEEDLVGDLVHRDQAVASGKEVWIQPGSGLLRLLAQEVFLRVHSIDMEAGVP